MLNVNLPIKKEDSIDLGAITSKFNGILLLYITNKCVGYISYNSETYEWILHTEISEYAVNNIIIDCENLIDMVNSLNSKYKNNIELKAIPFTDINTIQCYFLI